MIHDRRFAFAFRLFAFVFTFSGLLDALGAFQGNIKPERFIFYTVLSNALGVIFFLIMVIKTGREWRGKGAIGNNGFYSGFAVACTIDLLLTLIVYWIILVPANFSMYDAFTPWRLNNLVVHLITPLLCLIDCILFVDSLSIKYRDIYYVLIFPMIYVIFVYLPLIFILPNGKTMSIPYYFMDYSRIGNKVFLSIFGTAIFLLILGHIAYFLNRKIKKPFFPRENKE
ncbi:Pr6Pr family membrane protein [Lacrimispora sp.]|uniref:Pr6Pr family membrane protein n=1 Tax=Lacrimispora sp. TaxID=2719234 RepID=UPI00289C7B23|nr:Pr6Pr family membrane protein [Lacrimispora sp.]